MKAVKMIALAFLASLFVAACEPAGDTGNQPQEPAAPSGGMGGGADGGGMGAGE